MKEIQTETMEHTEEPSELARPKTAVSPQVVIQITEKPVSKAPVMIGMLVPFSGWACLMFMGVTSRTYGVARKSAIYLSMTIAMAVGLILSLGNKFSVLIPVGGYILLHMIVCMDIWNFREDYASALSIVRRIDNRYTKEPKGILKGINLARIYTSFAAKPTNDVKAVRSKRSKQEIATQRNISKTVIKINGCSREELLNLKHINDEAADSFFEYIAVRGYISSLTEFRLATKLDILQLEEIEDRLSFEIPQTIKDNAPTEAGQRYLDI